MSKKILTLDNLYQFFVQQGETVNFNVNDSGSPIVVYTNGYFSKDEDDMPGMLKLKLKVCHTQTNRNGSHISDENMEKAMPTLKYRPILAYIHELPDGTKDFYAHNIEIIENEDGEEEIVYTEKQVGCFTADDPWLEYDKEMDKTYVMAYAVIPEEYTEAANIIRRKNGTKVSCELVINELSYNAKEKYLDLIDFYFGGTTLLGSDEDGNEIGEGMLGARADISDFCQKKPTFDYQDKLIEVLDKLNITLSNFSIIDSDKKGGEEAMDKFNELLELYGLTAEEIEFEHEGLSDEELEAAFTENFGEAEEFKKKKKCSVDDDGTGENHDEEKFTKTFSVELSHEDIRYALYNLIGVYEQEDNEWYGIYAVYDSYFVMQGWYNNKFYKQGYSVDGENVSLSGDRQELFMMLLTESEKIEIDSMRNNYASLKEFKENAEAQALQAKKDEIFNDEKYSILADNEKFKQLKDDAANFSVDEISDKCKVIFAEEVMAKGNYSASGESVENKPNKIGFNFETPNKRKVAYGGLFDD